MSKVYDNSIIQDLIYINDKAFCKRTIEQAVSRFNKIKDSLDTADREFLDDKLQLIQYGECSELYQNQLNSEIRKIVNRGGEFFPPRKDKSKDDRHYDGISEGRKKKAQYDEKLKNRQEKALQKNLGERVLSRFEQQCLADIEQPEIRDCVEKILDDIDRKMKIHFSIDYNVRRHMTPEAKAVKLPNGGVPYNHVYNWLVIILTQFRAEYVVDRKTTYKNNDIITISWR